MPPLGHQPDHLRASHEVLTGKKNVLVEMHLTHDRLRDLMNADRNSRQANRMEQRKNRNLLESGHDPAHSADIALISSATQNIDPHTIKHEFDHLWLHNHQPVVIGDYTMQPPPLMGIAAQPIRDIRAHVNYRNNFWRRQHSVDEIFAEINGKEMRELNGLGITFAAALGLTPSSTLPEAEAKKMAEILHIPYLRDRFGDCSETNMGMAQVMAREMMLVDPSFLSILKLADTKEEEAKKGRKADLRRLIRDLEKMEIPGDRNCRDIENEFTTVDNDIRTFRRPPPTLNRDEMQQLKELRQEREALTKELGRYRRFAEHLNAIRAQIGRISDLSMPTSGEFHRLAGAPVVFTNLTSQDSPKNISLELASQFAEIMKEEETKKDEKPASKPEAPNGSDAILRIYEAYLQRTQNLSPRMARSRAAQMFMENEFTAEETHFIDDTIRRDVAKGVLTLQQGVFSGIAGYMKRFTPSGSDEARVTRIAESLGVTRAVGEGGVLNSLPLVTRGRYNPIHWLNKGMNWMFGTRVFGVTPFASYRARPAWGEIAGNRAKLRAAWDALREATEHGEFTNTWYIQDQLIEVAHLMIASEHQQMADMMAKMPPEERQKLGGNSVREFVLNHLHDVLEHGFVHGPQGATMPHAVTAGYEKARAASKSVGSGRRGFLKRMFTDGDDSEVDYNQAA